MLYGSNGARFLWASGIPIVADGQSQYVDWNRLFNPTYSTQAVSFLGRSLYFWCPRVVVNLGFFLHFRQRLGEAGTIPLKLWILTGFVILFAVAIALFKDIPDRDGDLQFQIRTLTVRLGSATVCQWACWVLSSCYLGIIAIALWGLPTVHQGLLLSTHLGILLLFWYRSRQLNPNNHRQVTQFYQWIWKLFFLEYIIFPLACLWG